MVEAEVQPSAVRVRRAMRCEHGFVEGLCTVKECPHWDGSRTERDTARTVKHDAWGKPQRERPEKRRKALR
jgi:hypothetical protein